MLFPVVVHKDRKSCFGVTIPDIPGCFTTGDSLQEALTNVQEAVVCHLRGEEVLPKPGNFEAHMKNRDYSGGVWCMVDIDLGTLESRAKRVNVTLPENLLRDIDAYAHRHGLSRSSFLAQAARQAITPKMA